MLVAVLQFDELDRDDAQRLLLACCADRRWAGEVVAGRPYGSMRAVLIAAADVLADLSPSAVAAALLAQSPDGEHRTLLRKRIDQAVTDGAGDPRADPCADLRVELAEAVRRRLVTTLR